MSSSNGPAGRVRTIVGWVLRILLAAMFVFSGGMKLIGAPEMVGLFDSVGIGQWFRYVTGGLEVAGAIGLLLPRLAGPAALGLFGVMVGAILTHLLVIGGSILSPLVLLAASGIVAWLKFADTAGLARAVFGRARPRTATSDRTG